MSLKPNPITPVPEETVRVARAAFPKGNVYMKMRDELGVFFQDEDFTALFPRRGQPAKSPWRLALVMIMQYAENLTDRQAADAVRSRIDWKYALGLKLTNPGFHFSILSEFRERLIEGEAEQLLLDLMLTRFSELGLLKARGRQRTDSSHVVAATRDLSRLECAGEALRQVLERIATLEPEWLLAQVTPEWFDRYGARFEEYRLPRKSDERLALAELVGADGIHLLSRIYHSSNAPDHLKQESVVETMRQIWIQLYYQEEGQTRWRQKGNLPKPAQTIASPYDLQARYATKRATKWTGYKVHLSETCNADSPHLITHVETTPATVQDISVVEDVHASLATKELLPCEHLVDAGYVSSDVLASSDDLYAIDLVGPVRPDTSWQAKAGQGFDISHFTIDWDTETVSCPQGKMNRTWIYGKGKHGKPDVQVAFDPADCGPCVERALCTRSPNYRGRHITFQRQAEQRALQSARDRQKTEPFKQLYKARAAIEGTISQAMNPKAMRRSRYRGLAKTHLQHVATAAAINLSRTIAWLLGEPRASTRVSHFAALAT